MKNMTSQNQAGFLMAKIRQVGGRIFERMLNRYGIEINAAQGRIMFALWQADGVSINELAQKTQLKKSTLTSMLDRLEKMGYLRRRRCDKDRRIIRIFRTPKDKGLEKKYIRLSEEMTRLYFKDFSKNEMNRFEKDLARILNNLVEYENQLEGNWFSEDS